MQVTEARPVINTEQASVIDSKTSEQIQAIPVNFRAGGTNSIASALSFVPGVQADGGGSLSLAGNLPYMLTASIDGIWSINVRSNGLLTEMFPSADGVDEIKISTTSVNAEYAQVGDITTTSRGGTNKMHGSVFWYHQNGAFVARDFFAVRAPFKVSNDFGGAIGGPVIKNRPFFFFDYEGLRYRAQSNRPQRVCWSRNALGTWHGKCFIECSEALLRNRERVFSTGRFSSEPDESCQFCGTWIEYQRVVVWRNQLNPRPGRIRRTAIASEPSLYVISDI